MISLSTSSPSLTSLLVSPSSVASSLMSPSSQSNVERVYSFLIEPFQSFFSDPGRKKRDRWYTQFPGKLGGDQFRKLSSFKTTCPGSVDEGTKAAINIVQVRTVRVGLELSLMTEIFLVLAWRTPQLDMQTLLSSRSIRTHLVGTVQCLAENRTRGSWVRVSNATSVL